MTDGIVGHFDCNIDNPLQHVWSLWQMCARVRVRVIHKAGLYPILGFTVEQPLVDKQQQAAAPDAAQTSMNGKNGMLRSEVVSCEG